MASARPLRREGSTEHPVFRLFSEMPGEHLVFEFINHIRTTGMPETFPGIHPGPLDKTEPFRKLAPFNIDQNKRLDGNMAYCPMCHQPNKYLEGSFVYLPGLQDIAAIGHECAAKDNRLAADRDYRARRDRRIEEDYLLANLPYVSQKLEAITDARPAADEALRVYRALRNCAPDAVAQLRAAAKKSGLLTIAETIDSEIAEVGPSGFKGTNGKQTRDVVIGTLVGTTAVIREYNPVTELDRIESVLRAMPSCADQDDALEAICQMSDRERNWTATNLRETDNKFRKFKDRIADFCSFFSSGNVTNIDAWTRHPEHPSRFWIRVTEQRGGILLTIKSRLNRLSIFISPAIYSYEAGWPLPEQDDIRKY